MEIKDKIKLIATDMDGTLVNDKKELPAGFNDWVVSHPQIKVAIASGRSYYTNVKLFKSIADKLIIIGDNGGLIWEKGKILYECGVPSEDVKYWVDFFDKDPLTTPILCATNEAITYDPKDDKEFLFQLDTYYSQRHYAGDAKRLGEEADKQPIIKMSIYIRNKQAEEVYKQVLEHIPDNLTAILAGPEWIDIVNKKVSKGAALRIIEEQKGITRDEIMAFGDYMNDYTMIQEAGESYAMENAYPDLKKIAKHIAPSNNDEGVMKVLEEVFDK